MAKSIKEEQAQNLADMRKAKQPTVEALLAMLENLAAHTATQELAHCKHFKAKND